MRGTGLVGFFTKTIQTRVKIEKFASICVVLLDTFYKNNFKTRQN